MSAPKVVPAIFSGQQAVAPAGDELLSPPKGSESPQAGTGSAQPSLVLKSARQAADEALAAARRDAGTLYGTSRRSSGGSRRRSRTPPRRRRRSPSRVARSGQADRGREGPRRAAVSPGRRPSNDEGVYIEFYKASLSASSEEAHVGLLAQFFASTSQGKDRSEAVLGQIASRVRAWGVALHDFYIFTDEEIKRYLADDPAEGPGPSLSKAFSQRGVVLEAVALARALHARHVPTADVEAFVGRLAGAGPRDGSSASSARSRSKRRRSERSSGPAASSGLDPIQKLADVLGRLENSGKKVHHFDSNPDPIHFDVTAVRSRPMSGDHSDIDPLSFPDHESISKLKHTLDSYREWTSLPFLHHARVESFQPRWLGCRLSATQKEAYVRQAPPQEGVGLDGPAVQRVALLLARTHGGRSRHLPTSRVPHLPPSQDQREDYHSDYAILYHDRFMAGIRQRISMGEDFDIGAAISRIDGNVLRDVDHKRSSGSDPPLATRGRGRARARARARGPPAIPRPPRILRPGPRAAGASASLTTPPTRRSAGLRIVLASTSTRTSPRTRPASSRLRRRSRRPRSSGGRGLPRFDSMTLPPRTLLGEGGTLPQPRPLQDSHANRLPWPP